MNISNGEGMTSGWNSKLQSIPTAEAQSAIERAYRRMGRPFTRPAHWNDKIDTPWRPGATTVVRDVRVADSEPRRHNAARVVDRLDRHGNRILPRHTRNEDGLLPPNVPSHTRDKDEDIQELMRFLARYFMRENPSSTTKDHETDLPQDDSIPARAYRDTWGRPENAGARRLRAADTNEVLNQHYRNRLGQPMSTDSKPPAVPSSDHLRTATERAKAMDSLGLDPLELTQAQAIESGALAYFPEWRR